MSKRLGAKEPHLNVLSRFWQAGQRSGITRLIDFSSTSRRAIATHRRRRKDLDRQVSDQSRWGLDLTNFFMADVQVGFGSFLAFYLANLDWSKQDVGMALTVGGLAGVVAQIPGGALADAVRWKRGLVAVSIVMVAASALILALWPTYPLVFAAEILHGTTGGLLGTAIAAISLGLAGQRGMALRIGRNSRFAAAGNAATAAAMGAFATYISTGAIFITAAILCIPTLIAVSLIRPEEIDYARARNAAKRDHTLSLQRVVDLRKNRNLLVFAGCMVTFHLCNASLLPLVGQNLGQSKEALGPLFMAGLLIVPQIVVAILAPWIGYWSELFGRKQLLLAGFAFEAVRALLFSLTSDPWFMIAIQLLDGMTGAVVTVLTILVVTDLTSGTGRFNLAQGVLGTFTGIAAAVSTGAFGFLVQYFGDLVGLLTMMAGTIAGMAVLWAFLPETKPAKYAD
jgi:predicted MFS family arabinose efflux permease